MVLRSHIGAPARISPTPHRARQPVHRRRGHPHQGRHGHPRRAVLGARRRSWPPTAHCAERGRAAHAEWTTLRRAADRSTRRAGTPLWPPPGSPAGRHRCPSSNRATSIATRVADREGLQRRRSTACPASSPAPPTSPATPAPSSPDQLPAVTRHARRPPGVLRRPRARMGSAMVGMALHGGVLPAAAPSSCSSTTCARGAPGRAQRRQGRVRVHPRLGRRRRGRPHAPAGRARLATLRAIPDLQVIRPADANETVAAWQAASSTTAPRARALPPEPHRCAPTVRPCSPGPASCAMLPTRKSCSWPLAARCRCAWRPPPRSRPGRRRSRRQPAVVGPLRSAVRCVPRLGAARRGARALRRGRHHVRLGPVGLRQHRHRPLRRQRPRWRRARPISASTSPTSWLAPPRWPARRADPTWTV
jgi:hypothetical protein